MAENGRASTVAPARREPEAAEPAEQAPREGAERGRRAERVPRERRRWGRGARNAGAATVGAVGAGVITLARLIMAAAVLIALLIGLGIALRDADANQSNAVVKGITEAANFFAGGFNGLAKSAGHPKRELSIDWGVAAVCYLIGGAIVSRVIARAGFGGTRFHRAHRAV